tara:strand:- start:327 stop:1325 length:999 start_codon:yes stop_codon:yes gene_type:complete
MVNKIRVAVVGAGISGLTFSRELGDGFNVTIFEKANRPGGRVTSKVINGADLDYGAQFFTAKTPEFQAMVSEMESKFVVESWQGHFIEFDHKAICSERDWDETHPHYVGTPNMSAISEWMADSLDIDYQTTVTYMERKANMWHLYEGDSELGQFDWVVLTMPPKQACDLLPTEHAFHPVLSSIKMRACFALRVVLNEDVDLGFNAALVRNHDISWISKNSTKPKRIGAPSIVVHATNAWADAHLNDDLEQVEKHMLECLYDITGLPVKALASSDVKKWEFANAPKRPGSGFLLDSAGGIAVCGDSLVHGRIESAFTSGKQLAKTISQEVEIT